MVLPSNSVAFFMVLEMTAQLSDSSKDSHKWNWPMGLTRHVFCLTSHYVYLFLLTVQLSTMATTVKLRLKKDSHTQGCPFCGSLFAVCCGVSVWTLCLSLFVLYYPFSTFIFISHSAPAVVVAASVLALSLLPISCSCFLYCFCRYGRWSARKCGQFLLIAMSLFYGLYFLPDASA